MIFDDVPLYRTGSWSKARNTGASDLDFFTDAMTWVKECAPLLSKNNVDYVCRSQAFVDKLKQSFNDHGLITVVFIESLNMEVQIQNTKEDLLRRIHAEGREITECLTELYAKSTLTPEEKLRLLRLVRNLERLYTTGD